MNHVKTYTINLMPLSRGYRAVCPGLPDCSAVGTNKQEAIERIEDLIRDRVRDAVVHGRPAPVDRTSTKFIWIDVEEFLV